MGHLENLFVRLIAGRRRILFSETAAHQQPTQQRHI
jgi:hypothetical protein